MVRSSQPSHRGVIGEDIHASQPWTHLTDVDDPCVGCVWKTGFLEKERSEPVSNFLPSLLEHTLAPVLWIGEEEL